MPGNVALGLTQIFLWGGSFFLIAVLADPIVQSTGWPQGMVVGALSLAILISGVLSPWIGRMIHRHGGRTVLVAGSLVIAAGQILMAVSPNLPIFLVAWAVIGAGMAAALYDPLFAAIGQAYGASARRAMTQIAIASGCAITVCWPATRFLVVQVGWRGTCVVYAALAVLVVAPLFAWALPRRDRITAAGLGAVALIGLIAFGAGRLSQARVEPTKTLIRIVQAKLLVSLLVAGIWRTIFDRV